jgi:type I restriction enzyme S subunit
MGSEWQVVCVADLASDRRNALVGGPFGSNLISTDYVADGVPVIRGQNMGGRWLEGPFAFVTSTKAESLAANLARPRDLVFTQRGTLGQVSLVPPGPYERYLISQSQMKLTVDERIADPLFFYYLFASDTYQDYFRQHAIQTGVPHTNLSILRDTQVPLPPLGAQRAIARMLGALDDKIELNRRISQTLESMASALFKSWFVDFDPVHAKEEHRETHLSEVVSSAFPSSFEPSELGLAPSGWPAVSLGDLCRRVAMGPFGSDITVDNFTDSGVPVVRGNNLKDGFLDDAFAFVSPAKADQLRNANAFPEDIIVTHRGTLGQVGFIPMASRHPRYVVSQSQMLVSVDGARAIAEYVYQYLRSTVGLQALLANVSQTGVPAIARPTTSLRAMRLLAPPLRVQEAFGSIAGPAMTRLAANMHESQSLTLIRARLLEHLLSPSATSERPLPAASVR